MEKVTLGYNYIDDKRKKEIVDNLKDGKAVNVVANCIGHTRAEMVEADAKKIFAEVGAKIAFTEHGMFDYYTL